MTTTSARPAFDDALRHYAATLGFPSLSSYIIWCRKNGLALQRDKTENQLAIERQLAADTLRPVAPHPGRSHTPGCAHLIDRAFRGEIPPDERYPLSRKLVALVAAAEDPKRRQALYRLLKHIERRADLLGLKTGFLNRTREEGNNYEDALGEEDAWEASGFRGFEWEEEDAFSGERVRWSIRELCTALDLLAEGRVMHHCAASYARRCSEGERSVWSMQMTYPAKLPQRILTIALDNHKKTVVDYRGKYNMHPHDNKRTAKKHWQDRPYLYYLRQSPRILRLWMEREDLRHD